MDRSVELKTELEALQKHSTLLTQQNKDLQKELDSFVETDAIVRRNLERAEKVSTIRSNVNTAISQSSAIVQQSRTPTKFQAERVSTVSGTAGVKRTSYSGAGERLTNNIVRTSNVNSGLESRTFDQRQYSDRGSYEIVQPVQYEQKQFQTISQPVQYVREVEATQSSAVGGYRYKTGGSPLRKDSPKREVSRGQ